MKVPSPAWARRIVLGVLLSGALAGGALAWWLETGRHLFHPKNFGVVEEGGIYRSGQVHRRLIAGVLAEHAIDVVLDLSADHDDDEDEAREREAVRAAGVRKVDLVSLDGYGLGDVADYVVALREILRARARGEVVLVHCAGGSERTGATVALYRMLVQGWSGPRAWQEYLAYRKDPPERDDLRRFLAENLPVIAARLEAEGAIARVPDPLPRFGP